MHRFFWRRAVRTQNARLTIESGQRCSCSHTSSCAVCACTSAEITSLAAASLSAAWARSLWRRASLLLHLRRHPHEQPSPQRHTTAPDARPTRRHWSQGMPPAVPRGTTWRRAWATQAPIFGSVEVWQPLLKLSHFHVCPPTQSAGSRPKPAPSHISNRYASLPAVQPSFGCVHFIFTRM